MLDTDSDTDTSVEGVLFLEGLPVWQLLAVMAHEVRCGGSRWVEKWRWVEVKSGKARRGEGRRGD
jgi:hypothetical protein